MPAVSTKNTLQAAGITEEANGAWSEQRIREPTARPKGMDRNLHLHNVIPTGIALEDVSLYLCAPAFIQTGSGLRA